MTGEPAQTPFDGRAWLAEVIRQYRRSYHTGQVVQLARHFAGADWQTPSIPPGGSETYNARQRERWGDWSQADEDGAV